MTALTYDSPLIDPSLVMAEQSVHDVVNQNQSVGDLSPSDASASQTNHQVTRGGERGGQAAGKNGFESQPQPSTGASEANRLKLGGDIVTNGLSHVCPQQCTLSHSL